MREGLEKIINSKSKTLLAFCFCFILGSAVFSVLDIYNALFWYLYYIICTIVALLIIFFQKNIIRFVLLLVLFIFLGAARVVTTSSDCTSAANVCFFNGKSVNLNGYVSAEPNQKVGATEYIVRINKIFFDKSEKSISGKILVRTLPYPEYEYGDNLRISCRLQDPGSLDTGDFRYDKYLQKSGVYSVCYSPKISGLGGRSGNILLKNIYNFKQNLNDKIHLLWVEPNASLMAGILYGGKSGLPKNLTDSFSNTGVSHIVAVSGFNITIIVVVLAQLLIFFGLNRNRAFYVVLVFTILFVIFSGLSASALRAGIMGVIVLLAKQAGREGRMMNVLVFTVAFMQLFNPYLLVWDAGFQLSFLATLGLVYLAPVINLFFKNIPFGILREPLLTTVSAIIMTLPLILLQFGTLSFIAPLVNILILWIIPYLMLAGAMSLAASFVFLPLARVFSSLAHLGLSYVIMLVEYFGKQSYSYASLKISFSSMVVLYAVIIFLIIKFHEKSKSL